MARKWNIFNGDIGNETTYNVEVLKSNLCD